MAGANEEKNGMDNLKIMDAGNKPQPTQGVHQVMIAAMGGSTDLVHSLKP